MPLLPPEQIVQLFPPLEGKAGYSVASFLRRLLSIDKVSDLYDLCSGSRGSEFAGKLLERLGIDYGIGHPERLMELPDGPFITISNHPYGGIDGIILIDLIGHLRDDFKVMVNEFLTLVEALQPSLIAVNPRNAASTMVTARSITGVREVLQRIHEGHPVGFFPAGAVSNLTDKGIRDREWQNSVIKVIRKVHVPILPVRFFDRNSWWFYLLGLIDWKIRALRLPKELLNKSGKKTRIGIGRLITVKEQLAHPDTEDFKAFIRDSVYGMTLPPSFTRHSDYLKIPRTGKNSAKGR